MQYTFEKGFYDDGENKLTFIQSFNWNKMIFKTRVNLQISGIKFRIKSKIREATKFAHPIYRKINLELKTKFILFKLRNKPGLTVEYSPFSESRYVMYDYLDYYVKIRISTHAKSRWDNSNIYVYA